MIKAVIIDVDDTLCMTEAICFQIENEALVALGRQPMSREIHIETWGRPLHEAIIDRSPGVDANAFIRTIIPIIDAYDSAGKFLAIPESNYQALDELIANGKMIMLLTSRTKAEMAGLLAPSHPIASRLTAAYYIENTKFHKPDPRVFDKLLKKYKLTPTECVYIGDSLRDSQATKGAGLFFIASLESGLRSKEDFGRVQVDAYIHAFPQILGLIRKLDKR